MKLCTLLKFDESGDRVAEASLSVVPDDHSFGWDDKGQLHMQGTIKVVANQEGLAPGEPLWSYNEGHEDNWNVSEPKTVLGRIKKRQQEEEKAMRESNDG